MAGKAKSDGAAAKAAPLAPERTVAPAHNRGPADVLDFTAPDGGVVPNRFYAIGDMAVYSSVAAKAGVRFAGTVAGRFESAPKRAGETWREGQALFFDGEAFTAGDDVSGILGLPVAHAIADAAEDDTAGWVRLRN